MTFSPTMNRVALGWFIIFAGACLLGRLYPQFTVNEQALSYSPLDIIRAILPGNLLVAIILSIGGVITFGSLTFMQLAWLALLFGLQAMGVADSAGTGHLLMATLPHAVLELPGFWLASVVGLRGGAIFRKFVFFQTEPPLPIVKQLIKTGCTSMGLVFMAAIVESFITPILIRGGW